MDSPVDNPKFFYDPTAWWQVRYFVRDRYIDVEVQAPNEFYAKLFASRCLMMDGIASNILTGIGIKRIEGPTE